MALKLVSQLDAGSKNAVKGMERGYSKDIIAKRLSPENKMGDRKDFMYHILRQEEGRGMSRGELEQNAGILVIAGMFAFGFSTTHEVSQEVSKVVLLFESEN